MYKPPTFCNKLASSLVPTSKKVNQTSDHLVQMKIHSITRFLCGIFVNIQDTCR